MTRSARIRYHNPKNGTQGDGLRTIFWKPSGPETYKTYTGSGLGYEECRDQHGGTQPWPDSPFSHWKSKGWPASYTVSGFQDALSYSATWASIPVMGPSFKALWNLPWDNPSLQLPFISDDDLGAMAVASMNPNNPEVDLPVFLFELRELPQLYKDAGDILLGKLKPSQAGAKANLAVSFGVLPMISDLWKLTYFTEKVDRREKLLRELATGEKRYRRVLARDALSKTFDDGPFTDWPAIRCRTNVSVQRKYWFTARGKLLSPPAERDMRNAAMRSALGLYPSLSQVWEAIPWSWLIDWFTNTGLIARAYRGGLKWSYGDINVMMRTKYTLSGSTTGVPSYLTVSNGSLSGTAKTEFRWQPSGITLPKLKMPYFTAFQVGILSSLALLRVWR